MMVGTALYLAPEQAMGGEVTPRSDLYSLGCVLYELVTGRPPFVGDESVAIIGQHLNANPVAPSWHRPDCPQALEALILRLLEKDPAQAACLGRRRWSRRSAGISAPPRPARRAGRQPAATPAERQQPTRSTAASSSGARRSCGSSRRRSTRPSPARAGW